MYKKVLKSCPLCRSNYISYKYSIDKYRLEFNVDVCNACGFMFMNPPFKDSVIKKFYSEDYFKGRADYSYHDERKIKKYSKYVWDRRVEVIHKFVESGNFLDVGCSFGGLLESARKYFIPYGIEFSDYAYSHCRKIFGDSIHHGTLLDHRFPAGTFSVITMIELIEHLADPAGAVRECFKLLRTGGLLVVQTANMNGKQARDLAENYEYFMPGHLSYFTVKNLAELLKNTGFGSIRVFYPVEFGLLPKLLKSRGSFKMFSDYSAWFRIASYHMKSKIHFRDFAMTSSMVIYAFKDV